MSCLSAPHHSSFHHNHSLLPNALSFPTLFPPHPTPGLADPQEEEWRDEIAQRVLLRQGDFFFVPPGNIYRLENHSR